MSTTFLINGLLLLSIAVSAFTLGDEKHEIADLKQRLAVLEKSNISKEENKFWADNIAVGGVLELGASYEGSDSDSSLSDLVVATAELGFEAAVTDEISTLVTL